MDYRKTLNLPQTEFPMRGDLPRREPEILALWERLELYRLVRERTRGGPRFVLHDGPPYPSGRIHLGQGLNKILKDIVVRYKSLRGCDSPYVPGWDMHGLPTEHAVMEESGRGPDEESPLAWRRRCSEWAHRLADVQMQEFQRLGVLGDWKRRYLTSRPEFEARELEVFLDLYEKGQVYRGAKPVYWCWYHKTTLAGAEIEFQEKTSDSIYVAFPVQDGLPKELQAAVGQRPVAVAVWTTTPWTLPGNAAVAFHPEAEYGLYEVDGRLLVMAKALAGTVGEAIEAEVRGPLAEVKGSVFEGMEMAHPLFARSSVGVLADYVSMEEGTGCVHTAPGHGEEDFETGKKYGLAALSPLDDRGVFTAEAGPYQGRFCEDANGRIMDDLQASGRLLARGRVQHQYAHCWRCKNPVIYRTTEQWFLDIAGRRQELLAAVGGVEWLPTGSEYRMRGMLETAPDWCLSRQRVWGVPLPAFRCQACGKMSLSRAKVERVIEAVRREGSDAWWAHTAKELLGQQCRCEECGSDDLVQAEDTLSPWFDSGTSWRGVLAEDPELGLPADVYLEGSDQHRGWFQSSLVTSYGMEGRPPYRAVITHGFFVDEQGRKMSKSQRNAVSPAEIVSRYGADVLRLWVASLDYGKDIRVSERILGQAVEAYRRIRNTVRFLLGNLYDFKSAEQRVAYERLPEMDKWMLQRLAWLVEQVTQGYDKYRFHAVYREVQNFCVSDLSAFYLDVLKDRLYTSEPDSEARRAAQTVLYELLRGLLVLIAPVLPLTAEEAYQLAPDLGDKNASVQLESWPEPPGEWVSEERARRWALLLEARGEALRALERAKEAGVVERPLEAYLSVKCEREVYQALGVLREHLSAFLGVSQVLVQPAERGELPEGQRVAVAVQRAEGEKCERCWLVLPTTGMSERHPGLCARCLEVVSAAE